jgi:hypothetical protein
MEMVMMMMLMAMEACSASVVYSAMKGNPRIRERRKTLTAELRGEA